MKKIFVLMLLTFFLLPASLMANRAEFLTIFMWSEYMDPAIIKSFEEEYNAKVRFDYYESNEEMIAKLQSGGLGQYDIIMPSTYFVGTLKQLKLIVPLDQAQIPNLKNLSNYFTTLAVDEGNNYVVPYQWGTSGLVVKTDNFANLDHSWNILFDETKNIGSFVLFDTGRDVFGSALKYLGYSFNSKEPKEIKEAMDLLINLKTKNKNFVGFDGGVGGLNKVLGGVASVAQVYNGEALKAQEEDASIHYIIPKEGAELWIDLMAIPAKAPNPKMAHNFINYILKAEIGAQLSNYNRYATPNEAAKEFISKEDLENPILYPSLEENKNFEYMQDLSAANNLYDEAWTLVKTK